MSVYLNTTVSIVIVQGILVPAMHEDESFSFCMCNPPFFGNLQEAGCNPHTAYAGNLPGKLPVMLHPGLLLVPGAPIPALHGIDFAFFLSFFLPNFV